MGVIFQNNSQSHLTGLQEFSKKLQLLSGFLKNFDQRNQMALEFGILLNFLEQLGNGFASPIIKIQLFSLTTIK